MSAIEVIFPKVRGEIMRLLFSDPAKEFHLRELSRLSSLALGTIQQEVSKLTRADLLIARRDGNRLYYRANTGHPIFSELQGIALKTTCPSSAPRLISTNGSPPSAPPPPRNSRKGTGSACERNATPHRNSTLDKCSVAQ